MSAHYPHIQQNLIPYLNVSDGDAMIDFCKRAFGAELMFALPAGNGQYMHVDMRVEGATLMFSSMCFEGMTRQELRDPTVIPTISLMLYVEDCDATYARAIAAGAISSQAPQDMFYGDRTARVIGPDRTVWTIASHVEDVSPEEIQRRTKEMLNA
jgi:PhnB protein